MRVAVLGAGYAGLALARALENALPPDIELAVVEQSGQHLIRHEVHRVIRNPDLAEDLRIPLAELLDDATVHTERVSAIDRDRRRVTFSDGDTMAYDYAAICLGAETDFRDRDGLLAYGRPLRTVEDALAIRERTLDLLEDGGRIVVGGAGLSGIQVAGELAALARESNATDALPIELIEMRDAVAPGFGSRFQKAIRDELEARGVDVSTGITIEDADDGTLSTTDGPVPFDEFVWTGGITGTPAISGKREQVRGDLRLDDRTFVLGDAAQVVDRDGEVVPASAQAALAQADTAATNIERLVSHDPSSGGFEPRLETLAFSPRAWVVSVGDGAVASVGPSILRGRAALAVKASAAVGHRTSIGATERVIERIREKFGG